jgi:UDP-glucose 4-epimerase
MSVLVTGGAGYIGSHVARLLTETGTEVIVVDDLSTGIESRVSGLTSYRIDLAEPSAVAALEALMREHSVDSVIHLAALKRVGDSVENPEEYFNKNLGGQANLLLAMKSAGVKKLVFSSSAAAYGVPDVDLVSEDEAASPINPYGQTKLIGEWMAANAETAWGLRHVNLRYFNAAGAGWDDLADTQVLNLIPIVFEHLISFRDNFLTFFARKSESRSHIESCPPTQLTITLSGNCKTIHRPASTVYPIIKTKISASHNIPKFHWFNTQL